MSYCTACGARRRAEDLACRVCRQPLTPIAVEPEDTRPPGVDPPGADPAGARTVLPPGVVPPVVADLPTVLPPTPPSPPSPPLPPPPLPPAPPAPGPPTPVTPEAPTAVSPYPPPTAPSRRHPASTALAVLGLVLAVLASALVTVQFLRTQGGAASPEAAVEELVAAMVAQDPVGIIDLIAPPEVEGVDAVYGGAVGKAAAAGLVGKDQLLDAVSVEVTGLELETEELSDGLARVTVTDGAYELTWDPDRLPARLDFLAEASDGATYTGDLVPLLSGFIGDVTVDLVAAVMEERIGFGWVPGDEIAPSFLTLETDGRWFVSLIGSYVDWIWLTVEETGGPLVSTLLGEPDWDAADEEAEPVSGADPDEVAGNIETAVNDGDGEEILANLPAELVRPLAPYHRIIGLAADLVTVEVSDLEYSTSDEGDQQLVVLTEGEVDLNDGAFTVRPDGGCLDYAVSGVDAEYCWPEDSGIDETFVMLRRTDDGYQFDPIATAVAHLELWVANATDETLERLLASLKEQIS